MTLWELLGLLALAVVLAAIAVPNFVKARRTTSLDGCLLRMMWIEQAKEAWAKEKKKGPEDAPTERELLPYLQRRSPKWDGRPLPSGTIPVSVFPTCYLVTNGQPYLLGTVSRRVRCPFGSVDQGRFHMFDEKEYAYHYDLKPSTRGP